MVDFKQTLEKDEKLASQPDDEVLEGVLLKGKKRKRLTLYTVGFIVIGLIFAGRVLMSSQNATGWFGRGLLTHLSSFSTDKKIAGEKEDRINILLLGMGGEGHDGAYLTDTIMLASIKPSTKQVSLISFPRDLVTPVSGWQKINSINAYAEQELPGSGGPATMAAISELLQIPIHYYVRIDFNGFIKIIDELGGIEVDVENQLDDYGYPILGQEDNPNYYSRFEHLSVKPGRQTMDGSLALKYARSRHGVGGEGSDFARARRQQLVIEAVKNKLLSAKILLNPVTITRLSNEFANNVSTDISAWEAVRLWDLTKDIERSNIINTVLSDAPDNFLVSGKGDNGAYILTPRSGNFSAIRNLTRDIFLLNPTAAQTEAQNNQEAASVIILNGTWITGLAGKTSTALESANLEILETGNAAMRDYTQSTVYDLTGGKKDEALNNILRITGASFTPDYPAWLDNYRAATNTPDFILIVGTDNQ